MALIDKASLLFVPSVVAEGKAFNVLPSGNRAPDSTGQNSGYDQTRADFDFDRGSNTAATRIDSNGVLQKYRENELLQSNQFDTTWVSNNVTETSGQADKDGGSTAWKLERIAAFGNLTQNKSQSGVQTFSVFAKAGTYDWVYLRYANASPVFYRGAFFDLSNGVVGTIDANVIDAEIESVGDGWYRCSITYNQTISQLIVYPVASDGGQGDSGTGNIYIQNAQLESGLVSTDYLDSTSVTGKAGVLVDLPRINYDANGENGALLLEPQRANLLENSEYILGGDWNQLGGALSIAQNTTDTLSPEGKYNAGKITLSNTANRYFSSQGYNLGGLNNISASVWLKSDGADIEGALAFFNGSGGDAITITNEWQRFEINKTAANSTEYVGIDFRGAEYSTSGVVYCYGWQLENNATYPSSYIPTMGTAETRAADSCSVTGASDVIGQTEGTMFAEFDWEQKSGVYFVSDLSTGSTSNEILIAIGNTADNRIRFQIQNGGVDQVNFNSSAISSGTHKVALAYKANDVVAYLDGVQVATDTSATIPATSQYRLERANGTLGFSGGIKQATLFNERLSNAELATLTTL
jgi:hypothetical protein